MDQGKIIPAGILAAMAIGSQLTQSTLNTFHIGNDGDLVSKGVPRIQEILNNSSSVSRLVYSLDVQESVAILDQFDGCANRMEEVCLKMIVEQHPLETVSLPTWTSDWVSRFGPVNVQEEYALISVPISCRLMIKHNVSPRDLFSFHQTFQHSMTFLCCSRLDNETIWLLFSGLIEHEKITGLSVNTCAKDRREYYVEKVLIYQLLNSRVKGMVGVSKSWLNPGGTLGLVTTLDLMPDKFARFVEQICGRVSGLVCSRHDEMFNVFGIEVAYYCLVNELKSIMSDLLPCHIELIAMLMTQTGKILPINRYTIRTLTGNVLQRISFEEATKNLVDACQNGEVDYLTSVSSCVAASKVIFGTEKNEKRETTEWDSKRGQKRKAIKK